MPRDAAARPLRGGAATLFSRQRVIFAAPLQRSGASAARVGGSRPSRLSRDVKKMIAEEPETVKTLTGLDITAAMHQRTGRLPQATRVTAASRAAGILPLGPTDVTASRRTHLY
ncbi:hypothetical protein BU14_0477s0004 [Porphyra umbilicalis]|uniref:Uncharacterized protein n=1 Tax=Porphyra umbilicalis TaxID=2786 RepID=A0A1X6NTZ1_PORUM|nr:hypothetical protein BU14_0477s0004 [Porphyra umbilicalis]|eukprot:OSX72047.1 hypothetical protein BU14_0477s0004 [Porphyra umbilicalis]